MARSKPSSGQTAQQRWRHRNPSYWKAREKYNQNWNKNNAPKKVKKK